MEPYIYQPLPSPTSIRLIKFKADNDTDSIVCNFEIADISIPPEYFALSYAWGDTSNTVTIICDDKAVQVTQTLHAALLRFATTPFPIWADALSIDQQNVQEKTQQVNMMALIYSKAAKVMIWLGPDPHNDAPDLFKDIKALIEGLGIIHSIGGRFEQFDDDTGDLRWKLPDGRPVLSALPDALVDPNEGEKARLERFFRLPWFSRTWVMQECGLASRSGVLWGDQIIDWNPIGVAALFLLGRCKALLKSLNLASDVKNVLDLYMTFSPFVPMATFFHVLNTARQFKATDPRDKVFALLSHPTAHTLGRIGAVPHNASAWLVKNLAESWQASSNKAKDLPEALKADYSKTTDEVYLNLARDHVERTETLEILAAVQQDPTGVSDLFSPSWVPRWDYFVDTPTIGLYNSTHFASANRSAVVTASPTNDPNVLIVRGTLFSRVTSATKLLASSQFDLSLPDTDPLGPDSLLVQGFWTSNPIASTWLVSGLAQRHEEGNRYPQILAPFAGSGYALVDRESSLRGAYLHSWVAGKNMGEVDGFDLQADSNAYWDRLFWGTLGDPYHRAENNQSINKKVQWKRYRDSAAEVCNQRKFFFTHKGFFGIGPGALQAGDWVVVLLGTNAPFIVREADPDARDQTMAVPQDVKFKLVGECYVHGLMQGQAVRGNDIRRNIILI